MGESKKTVQLDWYSEVEQTAKQAGVPLFEHVICRPTTTVRCRDTNGSIKVLGSDFTYTTLQEFVSSVALPGRSGFQWDEWELKLELLLSQSSTTSRPSSTPRKLSNFSKMQSNIWSVNLLTPKSYGMYSPLPTRTVAMLELLT